jgi:hypothetical protein
LSNFERGQIVLVRLAGASVTKTATLLGVSRASFYGYVGIHKSWEDNMSKEEQWAKININGKRLLHTEGDHFEKSQTTAARVTAELNIHFHKNCWT